MKPDERRLVALHKQVTEEVGGEPTSNLDVVPSALAGLYALECCSARDVYDYLRLLTEMASQLYKNLDADDLRIHMAVQFGSSAERLGSKVVLRFLHGRQGGFSDRDISAGIDSETKLPARPGGRAITE